MPTVYLHPAVIIDDGADHYSGVVNRNGDGNSNDVIKSDDDDGSYVG